MDDLIGEFKSFIKENNQLTEKDVAILLNEIKLRLSKKINEYTDIHLSLPMMSVVTMLLKKEVYLSYQNIIKVDDLDNKYSMNVPYKIIKQIPITLMNILAIFHFNEGFIIQTEERFDNLEIVKNIESYPIPRNYTNKDIDKIVNTILNSIEKHKKLIK